MHQEKRTFKVNTQWLKPYFGGEVHVSKQAIHLSTPEIVSWGVMQSWDLGNIEIKGSRANNFKQSTT